MNRELPRDPGRPRRVNRPHRIARVPRIRFDGIWWLIFCTLIAVALALFAFTDVWPYMHEVIWQQSWKPVCDYGHGKLEFCRRP